MVKSKFTKGRWVLYSASSPSINECVKWSVYNGTKRIALCYNLFENDININVSVEEGKANALLISKVPILLDEHFKDLEFLEKIAKQLDELGGFLESDVLDRIEFKKQLIKEATEL